MDIYNIVKDAVYYGIGNIEPVEDFIDTYSFEDKVLFQFPSDNKKTINILVYDDSYDLYKEFRKATVKVYDKGEWIHNGAWVDYVESHLSTLESELEEYREELEQEKQEEEEREQREESRKLVRFEILFGADGVVGIVLPHQIPADKVYDKELQFEKDVDLDGFVYAMFEANTEIIIDKQHAEEDEKPLK